jgi:FkbM family methyltransferase
MGRKRTSPSFASAENVVGVIRRAASQRPANYGEEDRVYCMTAVGAAERADCAAVVTPPEQWAYALVVPVSPPRHLTQRFRVRLVVLVHHGAVGIGILTKSETQFYQEIVVPRASAWQEIELLTPPIGQAGPLVIRNASATGASRAQCRITGVYPAASKAPLPGYALVDIKPRSIDTIFSALPDNALLAMAEALAALLPLAPIPYWHWHAYEQNPDLAVHIRHAIWLTAKARGLQHPIIVPWRVGTRLALHLDNDLSHMLFVSGTFEHNEFALFDRLLQPGMVFVDGGANEGAYTVFAAARVGPAGRVIAVEPSRREIERLKLNLSLNELNGVELVEAAFTECAGPVKLTIAEREHAGLNTLGAFFYDGVATVGIETVAATTLDELVAECHLLRLDIVKLDLEGAELRALNGARRALAEPKPLLLIELSDAALKTQGGSQAALFELLQAAGYVVLTFDDATGEPVPLSSTGAPPSPNIVAVHAERDWGLLG